LGVRNKMYSELPWSNTKNWEWDVWYPLPIGTMWLPPEHTYHEGYSIFKREHENGDIESVIYGPFNFKKALNICEARNGRQLIERKEE